MYSWFWVMNVEYKYSGLRADSNTHHVTFSSRLHPPFNYLPILQQDNKHLTSYLVDETWCTTSLKLLPYFKKNYLGHYPFVLLCSNIIKRNTTGLACFVLHRITVAVFCWRSLAMGQWVGWNFPSLQGLQSHTAYR